MDSRTAALFALLVAALLVASPLFVALPGSAPTYQHDLEPIPQSEVPPSATIRHYEELSANAQAAIDDALHGDGVIAGEANEPEEFFYSDYASVGQGIYFIEKGGSYYRLTTFAGGGPFIVGLLVKALSVALGVAIGVVAWLSLRQDRERLPIAFGVWGLGDLAVQAFAPPGNWLFVAVGGAVAGVVAAVAAVGWTGPERAVRRAIGVLAALIAVLVVARFGPLLHGLVPAVVFSPVTLGLLTVLLLALAGGHLGRMGVGRTAGRPSGGE